MKILLLGKNGQVGWELQRSLSIISELVALGRQEVDIGNIYELRNCIKHYKPDILINSAAYTAVDNAEYESDMAYRVNADAVKVMAEEVRELKSWLIHFSTDYIFDGNKTSAYNERDPVGPLSVYGKSKYEGEKYINDSDAKHLIIRTSWVYASRGSNFVKTIIKLATEKSELEVVDDQFGTPTNAEMIADIVAIIVMNINKKIINNEIAGTYHLTACGKTNWFEFACAILGWAREYGLVLKTKPEAIKAINSDSCSFIAKRPKNSSLDTSKICNTFNIKIPKWQYHAQRAVDEIINKDSF